MHIWHTAFIIIALTHKVLSKHTQQGTFDQGTYNLIITFINQCPVIPNTETIYTLPTPGHIQSPTPPLKNSFVFYSYIYLNWQKYSANSLSRSKTQGGSLIQARFHDCDGYWTHCGVLQDIFHFDHAGRQYLLAFVCWLIPWGGDTPQIWKD